MRARRIWELGAPLAPRFLSLPAPLLSTFPPVCDVQDQCPDPCVKFACPLSRLHPSNIRLVKSGSKTTKNKPRPDPTFDLSRIRFLILIEFSLTTPNLGMVPPVHAGTQAGGLNYCCNPGVSRLDADVVESTRSAAT